jgi:hypothetical protein
LQFLLLGRDVHVYRHRRHYSITTSLESLKLVQSAIHAPFYMGFITSDFIQLFGHGQKALASAVVELQHSSLAFELGNHQLGTSIPQGFWRVLI